MSAKDLFDNDAESDKDYGDEGAESPSTSRYSYYPPRANLSVEVDRRSDIMALSYITCDKCKQMYIKGDDHLC